MNENIANPLDFQTLIKMHRANYALFRSKSSDEINQAVRGSLQNCPFSTAYYLQNNLGLARVVTFNPATRSPIKAAPDQIELSQADLEKSISKEVQISSLADSSLPDLIKSFFAALGCIQIAVIPTSQDGKRLGVLIAASQPGQLLDLEAIDPLIHLSEFIPAALQNILATRSSATFSRELDVITETNQVISSSNDLESIYKALHSQINATIGNVDFSIALFNSKNETIELPYVFEDGVIKSFEPFPLGEGVTSVLIRTCQPLMMVTDAERRLNALGGKVYGKPAKSWLGCPLIVANGAIGALVVQDLNHEQRFNQDDMRMLTTLASQASGAINNIRQLNDARRTALELRTVTEISKEVSSTLMIDDLLKQAVNLLYERFQFYHSAIYLFEANKEFALIREASGETGMLLKRAGEKYAVGSKSVVGYVLAQKELLVINETSKDSNYPANPILSNTMAEACFPLKVGDRIFGTLDVQSQLSYVFTDENISVLQILADQLAIAILNSERFADAQERLSQHRLLHHVTTAAASSSTVQEALNNAVLGLQVAMGGDQISIMMADKDQKNLDVKASAGYPNEESARLSLPFGVGITGWVAAHRQALRIGDTTKDSRYVSVNTKIRSELALPLIYRNEVLGILNVESTKLNAFNEDDEEMLGTLTGSLAAIIAHARLLDQFRQQVERERLLSEITNKIRRTTNPEQILAITAEELSKALNTRRTIVEVSLQNIQQTSSDSPIENRSKNT